LVTPENLHLSANNPEQLEAALRHSVDPDEFINLYGNLEFLQEHPAPAPVPLYRSLICQWYGNEPTKALAMLQRILCLLAAVDDRDCDEYLKQRGISSHALTYAAALVPLRAAKGKVRFSRKELFSIVHNYKEPDTEPKLRLLYR
jgi:hypothetical protein